MARPLRRVIIGLAIRMGIAPGVIETWPMPDIRDCVAMLQSINRAAEKKPEDQTPEEMMARFAALTPKEPREN